LFIVRNNSLYFIENKLLKEVLDYDALLHQAISLHQRIGHATAGILIAELRAKFWHPDIILIVQEVIRTCERCQLMLTPNIPSLPLQPIPPAQPLQRWGIDFTGPIAGYKMLNAVDYAIGYGTSQLCHSADHATIINFIKNLIYTFGTPAELISDNSASFLAHETRQFLDHYKIRYHQTTSYHPRTNGRWENFNGVIKKILSNILMAAVVLTTEEALKKALPIYNTKTFENGYSPHFLLFGVAHNLSNPAPTTFFYTREDTQDETKAFTKNLASREKELKDMIQNSVNSVKACQAHVRSLLAENKAFHRVFAKGDWVLRQREIKHKFEPFYDGPFSVISATEEILILS
ncbi:Pro-Pol polyprotein, partial [Golovinomyces cichoracearum]